MRACILMHERNVSVIGLGYVGLPVAIAFGLQRRTIGFDTNPKRLADLRNGFDRNGETSRDELAAAHMELTDCVDTLRQADFHIVAVPTPISAGAQPDLTPVRLASETVGRALKRGDVVVYESTVYPGVTEEICVPILARESGLKLGRDFTVGYSPERINPGDKQHTFRNIVKIVSGSDAATLDLVAKVYSSVVTAGVYRAGSIKVAEAAKLMENTQRDLNIALMNEAAIIFDYLDIDTRDVLDAASTKWNFLNFTPGLVGGHCIGVDPYYLTHKAQISGYSPLVILAGRRVNDGMGKFVAERVVKTLIRTGRAPLHAKAIVLGLTFKENCADLRNSKVIDIVRHLQDYGLTVQLHDPLADPEEAFHEYGVKLTRFDELEPADLIVLAVSHREFMAKTDALLALGKQGAVFADVKSCMPREAIDAAGLVTWRL
jgi:UDP-N-acetyl-D-glucosamine/UDP-N-acetyl-D-galactosamine dehydrogenase